MGEKAHFLLSFGFSKKKRNLIIQSQEVLERNFLVVRAGGPSASAGAMVSVPSRKISQAVEQLSLWPQLLSPPRNRTQCSQNKKYGKQKCPPSNFSLLSLGTLSKPLILPTPPHNIMLRSPFLGLLILDIICQLPDMVDENLGLLYPYSG